MDNNDFNIEVPNDRTADVRLYSMDNILNPLGVKRTRTEYPFTNSFNAMTHEHPDWTEEDWRLYDEEISARHRQVKLCPDVDGSGCET